MGLAVARWLRYPTWRSLFPGLGFVPLAGVLVRSSVLAWKRGDVMWRGCSYATAALKAGCRMP